MVSDFSISAPNHKPIFLNSGKVIPANAPFSEAVRVGDTIYLSGNVGLIPGTFKLIDGGIERETKQVMDNIKTSLEAHNLSMSDIVKCTVMMADISEWSTFNKIYITYFDKSYPARSAFGANGLALNARVEVDCIAVSSTL